MAKGIAMKIRAAIERNIQQTCEDSSPEHTYCTDCTTKVAVESMLKEILTIVAKSKRDAQ